MCLYHSVDQAMYTDYNHLVPVEKRLHKQVDDESTVLRKQLRLTQVRRMNYSFHCNGSL